MKSHLLGGKYKAFSTCASHLSVVSLFYCTGLGVYLSSAATHSSHSTATMSVMYIVVTPMLNPFIYSLRNKDIKRALNTFFRKGLLVFHWGRAHDWRLQSLRARNCRSLMSFFDQIVEFKLAPSIYFLKFPLIWLQLLPTISVTSFIKLVSSLISERFSPLFFFQLSNLSSPLDLKNWGIHIYHRIYHIYHRRVSFLNWRKVVYNVVSFRCTTKWLSYTYT